MDSSCSVTMVTLGSVTMDAPPGVQLALHALFPDTPPIGQESKGSWQFVTALAKQRTGFPCMITPYCRVAPCWSYSFSLPLTG